MTKEEVKKIIRSTSYNIYIKQSFGLLKYQQDDSEYLELLNIYDRFSDIEKEQLIFSMMLFINGIDRDLLKTDIKCVMFYTFIKHKNNAQIFKKLITI